MSKSNVPEIPASIKCRRRGSCVPAMLCCLPQLVEGRDFVVEGWICFDGQRHEHTWMLIDGEVFDPTVVQFLRFRGFPGGHLYIPKTKFTPLEIKLNWQANKSAWWRNRLASFGVPSTSWAFT
jgi:hypothetical protein